MQHFYFKMNLTKQIFTYIIITRPVNVVITFLVVAVAILISENNPTAWTTIIIVSSAEALIAAAGNIINDYFDIQTDRIAHPQRVLVTNQISKNGAIVFYAALNLISIFLSSTISTTLLIITIITIIVLFHYSARLKRLPLIGNLTVSLLTASAFVYGGFAVDNPEAAVVPAVFAFLINMIREIVKDIEDIEGDLTINIKTFPIKYGIDSSKKMILIITLMLFVFTFYPFINQFYKIEYFIVVMIVVNPILGLCIKILFDNRRQNNYKLISSLLKLNMIFGLIAIYLGR
jgi:4-hydroxybenzoate polyprenyltransferase